MRSLLFTMGSPFARAVRIVLDELEIEYERREEVTTPTTERMAESTPTLQVPTFWDGDLILWESGTIAEYLLTTYTHRPAADPPMAEHPWRPEEEWRDRLIFSTVQTFGTAATTISQLKWTGVDVDQNAYLQRSAEKLTHILDWLESNLRDANNGFMTDRVSMQDIFLAAHVRFVQARPLGIDLHLSNFEKIYSLLARLDERKSFRSNPIWWWEPGVIGYGTDGTPVYHADS